MREVHVKVDAGVLACICGFVDVACLRTQMIGVNFFDGSIFATNGRSLAFVKVETKGFDAFDSGHGILINFDKSFISAIRYRAERLSLKIIIGDRSEQHICMIENEDSDNSERVAFSNLKVVEHNLGLRKIIDSMGDYSFVYRVNPMIMFPFISALSRQKIHSVRIAINKQQKSDKAIGMQIMLKPYDDYERVFYSVAMPMQLEDENMMKLFSIHGKSLPDMVKD